MNMATVMYHKDVAGFPDDMRRPTPNTELRYSRHALVAAADDGFKASELPLRLPANFELIEATTFAGRVYAWVVRFPITRVVEGKATPTGWDFVFALGFNHEVVTIFLNKSDDNHATLRRERYSAPERV